MVEKNKKQWINPVIIKKFVFNSGSLFREANG